VVMVHGMQETKQVQGNREKHWKECIKQET
jgi:hypothetical protein